MPEPLVLASRSPQRRAILEQLGIDFVVNPADVNELTTGDPRSLVIENALKKARAVDGDLILGADTEVHLDGRIYGKPENRDHAESLLDCLSGRTHEVWGGIALIEGTQERTASAVTKVRFKHLDPQLVNWYLASGEWRDRAGGYAIQGRGAAFVESIDGDFWNVVGLPVPELLELAPGLLQTAQSGQ
jgi:nucleoside triphosphate pyrophosphatase